MKESSPGIRNLVFDKGCSGAREGVGEGGGGVGRVGSVRVGPNCLSRNPKMLSGKIGSKKPNLESSQ